MTQMERICKARELLCNITPLKRDCGKCCNAACCSPDETGKGGMLLFPGEEAFYEGCNWAGVEKTEEGFMLTCSGICRREERPIACRIFPLTPVIRSGSLRIETDVRAWPVCPLMESGVQGMLPAFRTAVSQAMELLCEDEACRAHIEKLTGLIDSFTVWPQKR